jgi:hypothetical protein
MSKRAQVTYIVASTLTLLIAAGCGIGEVSGPDEAPPQDPATEVNDQVYSTTMLAVTHETIVKTRPEGTALVVKQLNLVLANNGIVQTTVPSVEDRVNKPLTNGQPTAACPYLSKGSGASTVTCRYLVDRALEDALLAAPKLTTQLQQKSETDNSALPQREISFVKGWITQAVRSGIDVGGVHTLAALRQTKVCDQSPSPKANAYKAGELQGRAVLEQAEKRVLPTIPKTLCETDVIASTIYAEAKKDLVTFQQQNPLCKGYKAADLSVAVDLAQMGNNHGEGLREGARQAHEALRVRLVKTWECWRCGNGTCDPNENCSLCAADCGACCGNSTCDKNFGESCGNCSKDCGACPPVCGDGKCEQGETCASCSSDCGKCPPKCGDGKCEAGESCASCSPDCGKCPPSCGDGKCQSGESCSNCSVDCGYCGGSPGNKVQCACFYRPARGGAKCCVAEAELKGQTIYSGFQLDKLYAQGVQQVPPGQCLNPPQYKTIGSPLVVDLDGNGIHLSQRRIRFDLAGTGEAVWIQAIEGRDALLTLDLDGDSRVGSGRELFGNSTACGAGTCTDGVEALQQHDANRDGYIDHRDPVYPLLRLWQDTNRDGTSSPAELTPLTSAGIRAIQLAARTDRSFSDAAGNSATRALTFKRRRGPDGVIYDVWFNLILDGAPSDPRTSGITSSLIVR